MHTITIRKNDAGKFDVLLNGFRYRIHRDMNDDEALKRAIEIKNEFAALKQRSIIETMSDRELLELAAKAAGHCYSWSDKYECLETWRDGDKIKRFWQPHRDDGDALRLAVKLGISVFSPDCAEHHNDGDVCAAVRLAIVRAAAEIGKRPNT